MSDKRFAAGWDLSGDVPQLVFSKSMATTANGIDISPDLEGNQLIFIKIPTQEILNMLKHALRGVEWHLAKKGRVDGTSKNL